MRTRFGMLTALLLLISCGTGQAVVVNATDIGASGTTNIQGRVENTVVPGLTGSLFLEFDGVTNGGLTWNFDYTVMNTSSGGITSRISSFGLNTTPEITAAASTGLYGFANLDPNGVPGFIGTVDFCFGSSANTCTGGNGLTNGQSASGEFTITFLAVLDAISLDAAYMRFQSIVGTALGDSGAGLNTGLTITPVDIDPVPIPGAVWLFAGGLGLLGMITGQRRRRRSAWDENNGAVANT